jgi:Flp pilus assembly protein CpaB
VNSRRTIILLVAVVVGAVASFGLLTYVRGVKDSAYEGSQLATVWVVKQPIPKGTTGETALSSGFIAEEQVPIEFQPSTAVKDPSVELANLVAVTDLPANAPLVAGNFVTPAVITTGITDRLEERGMVSFTLSLDQVHGAAFMIRPGDFVNILTVKPKAAQTAATAPDGTTPAPVADNSPYGADVRYVYQRVEVLAVDQALPADLGETTPDAGTGNLGMLTLALPPEAVQLILSVGPENLYFSLVPSNYVATPLPAPALPDVLPAEDPGQLTPYWATQTPAGTPLDGGTE